MEIVKKKLASGNLQIRFSINGFYGYMLADTNISDLDALEKINRHLQAMRNPERYLQKNLFSMATSNPQSGTILIFKEPANSMAA